MASSDTSMEVLEPLVGNWSALPEWEGAPPVDTGAPVSFEWMTGGRFLIQRWEVPVPEAPDGIALIGADPEREGGYLQHYFDSRGVARVYKMSFDGGVWSLWREEADFSPLEFAQRYSGTLSDDGGTISGAWEIRHDGQPWALDFKLTYTKIQGDRR